MGKITDIVWSIFEVLFWSVSGVKMLKLCCYRHFDYSPSATNYFFIETISKIPIDERNMLRKIFLFGNADNFIASSWLGLQFLLVASGDAMTIQFGRNRQENISEVPFHLAKSCPIHRRTTFIAKEKHKHWCRRWWMSHKVQST